MDSISTRSMFSASNAAFRPVFTPKYSVMQASNSAPSRSRAPLAHATAKGKSRASAYTPLLRISSISTVMTVSRITRHGERSALKPSCHTSTNSNRNNRPNPLNRMSFWQLNEKME